MSKRSKVFETNSSSTHSVTISMEDGLLTTMQLDDSGCIVLTGGEFGWQWERYNDTLTKANYCAVAGSNNAMLIRIIKFVTGAKHVVLNIHENSYIDHESVGAASEAFSSDQAMINFIFNPKSWLFLGNDNGTAPPNFYEVNEAATGYTHQLVIGNESVAKLRRPDLTEFEQLDDLFDSITNRRYPATKEAYPVFYRYCPSYSTCQYHSLHLINDNKIVLYRNYNSGDKPPTENDLILEFKIVEI